MALFKQLSPEEQAAADAAKAQKRAAAEQERAQRQADAERARFLPARRGKRVRPLRTVTRSFRLISLLWSKGPKS